MDSLERIAVALEAINDYYRHTCRLCEGTGSVIVSYDRKDSLGMVRDFTGINVVHDPTAERLGVEVVLVRESCAPCGGTGRIVPREVLPVRSVWG